MKKIFLSAVLLASSWVLFAQDTTTNNNGTMNNGTMNNNNTTNQQMNTSTNNNTNLNNTTSNQMYNNTSTSNYSAYGIPNYVQMNFQTQHPTVSNLTWDRPTADWYHGYYSDANGRYTNVYYSTDPYYNSQYYPERVTGYTVSLPVLETYVPDAVITAATNQYKQNLYDITALKGNNNQDLYEVRVLDNGEMKSMWMDANGAAVTDYWRTDQPMNNTTNVNTSTSTDTNAAMDNSNMNSSSSMNHTNMNTDTKMKKKTKLSNGTIMKTKTKHGKTKHTVSTSTDSNNQ